MYEVGPHIDGPKLTRKEQEWHHFDEDTNSILETSPDPDHYHHQPNLPKLNALRRRFKEASEEERGPLSEPRSILCKKLMILSKTEWHRKTDAEAEV